jgi:late competence protein required for DNA uptake (superfamily II DNA/RNA helicase)
MQTQTLLTTDETSSILRLKKATLAKWRCHRSHPELKYIKLGSRCFYCRDAVMSFIAGNVK